jgi:glucose/arabinose dehydrogenase
MKGETSMLLSEHSKSSRLLIILVLIFGISISESSEFFTIATASELGPPAEQSDLKVTDPKLKAELVYKGVQVISNMAFLGQDDILVLEKNNGTVMRVLNGTLQQEPLVDFNVVHSDGLLGIAVSSNSSKPRYVYLYVTEAPRSYGQDIETNEEMNYVNETLGYTRECNCVYRYEYSDGRLINPSLFLDLPAIPGPMHNGGEIIVGPDDNLYVSVGDITGHDTEATSTKAQNYENGPDPDGRAGILRITQDGQTVNGEGILGNKHPLDMYYAYGIRSSFGIDFDPLTGNLWDTENGPDHGDEINLVEPGFDSGADYIFGISSRFSEHTGKGDEFDPDRLVDFDGKGKYSDPEFTWEIPVGVTALQFLDSSKYGEEYKNDMFVGDVNNGNIYHFDLNAQSNRTELLLDEPLDDKTVDNPQEGNSTIFASGSGGITDLQVGPDGYLYILSTQKNSVVPGEGTVYRVVPSNS